MWINRRPHIIAAAALRLVTLTPAPTSLSTLSRDLAAALQRRTAALEPPGGQPSPSAIVDHWPADLPGEDGIPAAFFLGSARRPVSDDLATDQLLALLEALGQREPLPRALIAQAAAHPDPVVQWSVKRLLEGRQDDAAHQVGKMGL